MSLAHNSSIAAPSTYLISPTNPSSLNFLCLLTLITFLPETLCALPPNILISLTQEAYNRFYPIIRPGGLLISDQRYVKTERKVDAVQYELPLYKAVMEKVGKPIVYNVCMLGAVVGLTDLVKAESINKVLETRIPSAFFEMNRTALSLGIELAEAGRL